MLCDLDCGGAISSLVGENMGVSLSFVSNSCVDAWTKANSSNALPRDLLRAPRLLFMAKSVTALVRVSGGKSYSTSPSSTKRITHLFTFS